MFPVGVEGPECLPVVNIGHACRISKEVSIPSQMYDLWLVTD